MYAIKDITNTIIEGDTIAELKKIPSQSVDLIFADPPYFMQTEGTLLRTEGTKFEGIDDQWDKFDDYIHYDNFCKSWLKECQRILKKDGAIWVIGAFQNIYRLGYIMQNMGFWILNDVVWSKTNPAPNFRGTRFTNANEILLWCSKSKKSKYTFNYKTMKHLNDGKQMKSVWNIPLCTGNERIKDSNGKKAHPTQKPEKLLQNVILSSSKTGDVILDPFFGSGTTGAIAKLTGRNFIGIDRDQQYIKVANLRISKISPQLDNPTFKNVLDIAPPRVSTQKLIEAKYLISGEDFFANNHPDALAKINVDGYLSNKLETLSIHKMAATILKKTNHNGWNFWYVKRNNKLISIDTIRKQYRKEILNFIEHS